MSEGVFVCLCVPVGDGGFGCESVSVGGGGAHMWVGGK